jgi:terminase large subunit-like protein
VSRSSSPAVQQIWLQPLHPGQARAYRVLAGHLFMALRCGRRFGKTALAESWAAQGLLQGEEIGWFAPEHKHMAEVFANLKAVFAPILVASAKTPMTLRLSTGGRIDFWSLQNPISARGRRYHRIVIDEAAFAKDGDVNSDDSMMAIWEKAIKPTLFDYSGKALVCSNSAGRNPDNFFYNLCNDPRYGFVEFHATTMDNPLLPKRDEEETDEDWGQRRARYLKDLRANNDPLVFAQEYGAEFVDWSGVAFFNREKLLVDNQPVPTPSRCDSVFAVIDTAVKTGTDNDGTAVAFFSYDKHAATPLVILDWGVDQIEGAILEHWLPSVFSRLEELARLCGARMGSIGAFIEDKGAGMILLQQALRRGMRVQPIGTKLTAVGKDERAMSVSGYVHQGRIKYSSPAFHKITIYKGHSRNHLLDQVESFRIGAKDSRREDDLLDTFCYGIALALGNAEGF